MSRVALHQLAARHGIRPGLSERVGAAAARLGTSARMLRYAEDLGLAAPPRTAAGYRAYGERDLLAAALAFGLRALADPEFAAELRVLGRLARREQPLPLGALDFETEKARRLLRLAG